MSPGCHGEDRRTEVDGELARSVDRSSNDDNLLNNFRLVYGGKSPSLSPETNKGTNEDIGTVT